MAATKMRGDKKLVLLLNDRINGDEDDVEEEEEDCY